MLAALKNLPGGTIHLPGRERDRPDRERLAACFELVRAGARGAGGVRRGAGRATRARRDGAWRGSTTPWAPRPSTAGSRGEVGRAEAKGPRRSRRWPRSLLAAVTARAGGAPGDRGHEDGAHLAIARGDGPDLRRGPGRARSGRPAGHRAGAGRALARRAVPLPGRGVPGAHPALRAPPLDRERPRRRRAASEGGAGGLRRPRGGGIRRALRAGGAAGDAQGEALRPTGGPRPARGGLGPHGREGATPGGRPARCPDMAAASVPRLRLRRRDARDVQAPGLGLVGEVQADAARPRKG